MQAVRQRLEWVLQQEGYTQYDIDALTYVAQLANGGMRDALSMLDKVVSYDAGITLDVVNQALGLIGFEDSFNLLDAIFSKETASVLSVLDKLNSQGVDFRICIQDFRRFVLNAVKYSLGVDPSFIPMPRNEIEKFKLYPSDKRLFVLLARVNELVPKLTYDADPYTLVNTEFIRMVGEL